MSRSATNATPRVSLQGFSYRIFHGVARRLSPHFSDLGSQLTQGQIRIHPETFLSEMILFLILSAAGPATGIWLILTQQNIWGIPLLFTPSFVFVTFLIIPRFYAYQRASAIDSELPYAAAYITTMGRGGVSPVESLRRISNTRWFPATGKEAKTVLGRMEVFAEDPITAVDKVAANHPSRNFRDFFHGYVTAIRSGGDVLHYLSSKTMHLFELRQAEMKVLAERSTLMMEVFIVISIVMTSGFYVLYTVQNLLNVGGQSILSFMYFAYLFLPVVSILLLILVHSMQPRTPFSLSEPYETLLLSAPIAAAVLGIGYQFYQVNIVILTTAFLLILAIPPAISYHLSTRKQKGLEPHMTSFLRDLVEIRRTGLSPEKSIIQVATRRYGGLTDSVRNISTKLTLGSSLRKIFEGFASKVKNWFLLVNMYILVECIDVGGGTVETIESLAEFSRVSGDTEKAMRSSMRPFIILPYFSALLLVGTTLMIMIFFVQIPTSIARLPGQAPRTFDLGILPPIFIIAIIIHSWIMGIVGGKIATGNIAAGFIHAAILALTAFLASWAVLTYFGIPLIG